METHYSIHGEGIKVHAEPGVAALVDELLAPYRIASVDGSPSVMVKIELDRTMVVPAGASLVNIWAPPKRWLYCLDEVEYLTDGRTAFEMRPLEGRARGLVDRSLLDEPQILVQVFLLHAISELLRGRGLYFLHAAGLSGPDGDVLLCGQSGTGKSTLTVALVRQGWSYLSDDFVFLRSSPDRSIEAVALKRECKIAVNMIKAFPELDPLSNIQSREVEGDKRLVDLNLFYPGSFVDSIVPARCFFPMLVQEGESGVFPLRPSETLARLMSCSPTAHFPPLAEANADILKVFTRQARGWEVLIGPDRSGDPADAAAMIIEALRKAED